MNEDRKDFKEICVDKCIRLMEKYSSEEILRILTEFEEKAEKYKFYRPMHPFTGKYPITEDIKIYHIDDVTPDDESM